MKNKKMIIFVTTFTIVMMILCSTVLAMHPGEVFIDSDLEGAEELESFGEKILGVIQIIGFISSVLILMVLGIKYMMGSAEERSGYKKAMLPYLIGATMLFSVTTISGMVYEFAEGDKTISMRRLMMPFCPNGNYLTPTSVNTQTIPTLPPVTETAYICQKEDCGCGWDVLPTGPEIYLRDEPMFTWGCPRCKVMLTGTNKNYCNSCGKYYEY